VFGGDGRPRADSSSVAQRSVRGSLASEVKGKCRYIVNTYL
jgi:hypothetical protein